MFLKKQIIATLLAASVFSITTAGAAEVGVVEVFKTDEAKLAETQQLVENREFITRQMEYLDRGLVAIKANDGIFLSWRWLGTESSTTKYNLYRDGKKVNAFPLNITNFTDKSGTTESKYQVAAVVDGVEQEKCDEVTPWESNMLEIPLLDRPQAVEPDGEPMYADETGKKVVEYRPAETSIADLDGDGQLDIVLKWDPDNSKDNSEHGITAPVILDGYKLDGTHMWRINLGYNIRAGEHYTQFMVYDLDGDGKAEVVCKTADGTTDSKGKVIGHKNVVWRDDNGRILRGDEYLTVFNGETGEIINTIKYEPARGNIEDWGDDYGNRCDRFLACVAYLDGETPSVIMCRGYYTRTYLVAYNFVDGKLKKLWAFDSNKEQKYAGQGNHSIAVADVDFDGRDEIIYGAAVIDDDGKGLYSTGLGHGNAQHTSDLIPDRPGLEIFSGHESEDAEFGMEMRDARTGEIIWGSFEGRSLNRMASADIDPNYSGAESWMSDKMMTSDGTVIPVNNIDIRNFFIYWDGDFGRELQDGNMIYKWMPDRKASNMIFMPNGYISNGGTKAYPGITCDIFGDWREETIYFKEDSSTMAIFTTTVPTDYKIYTLMHDLQYRTYITTQNVAYNQPPHLGYYLGFDTKEIPAPRVKIAHGDAVYTNPDLEKGIKYYPIEGLVTGESVSMVIGSPFSMVNGKMTSIGGKNSEVAPLIRDDRTLVPLRFIAEAFGAEVNWDGDKREVTINQDDSTVKLVIDSASYTINDKEMTLDTPAAIISDLTYIPLRAVAEALGKKVAWDSRGVIYINSDTESLTDEQATMLYNDITSYVG